MGGCCSTEAKKGTEGDQKREVGVDNNNNKEKRDPNHDAAAEQVSENKIEATTNGQDDQRSPLASENSTNIVNHDQKNMDHHVTDINCTVKSAASPSTGPIPIEDLHDKYFRKQRKLCAQYVVNPKTGDNVIDNRQFPNVLVGKFCEEQLCGSMCIAVEETHFDVGSGFAYACTCDNALFLFASTHASESAHALVSGFVAQANQDDAQLEISKQVHDDFTFWRLSCNNSKINFAKQKCSPKTPDFAARATATSREESPEQENPNPNVDDNDSDVDDAIEVVLSVPSEVSDITDDGSEEFTQQQCLYLLPGEQSQHASIRLAQAYFLVQRDQLDASCRSFAGPGASGMTLRESGGTFPIGLLVGCAIDNQNLLIFVNLSYVFPAVTFKHAMHDNQHASEMSNDEFETCLADDGYKLTVGDVGSLRYFLRDGMIEFWDVTSCGNALVNKLELELDDEDEEPKVRCAMVLAFCLAQASSEETFSKNLQGAEKKSLNKTFAGWCKAVKDFAALFKVVGGSKTLMNSPEHLDKLNFGVGNFKLKIENNNNLNNYDVAAVCYTIWNQNFTMKNNNDKICIAGDEKASATTRKFTFVRGNVTPFFRMVFSLLFDVDHSNKVGAYLKGSGHEGSYSKTFDARCKAGKYATETQCDCINPSRPSMLDAFNGAHVIPERREDMRVWSIATHESPKIQELPKNLLPRRKWFPFSAIPFVDEAAVTFLQANKTAHRNRVTACHHPIQCEANEDAVVKNERKRYPGQHPSHICVRPT